MGCYYWIVIGYGSGKRYYRNYDLNQYISTDGEVMK